VVVTTDSKARRNGSGNAFPRLSARRRIPAQAFALKKNRCGTLPTSSVCDNEYTAASLGHSEILSVKKSVGEPIPEFAQPCEEGSKIPSSVRRQDAGDVFPNQPLGPISVSNRKVGKHEVATRVSQSCSKSCDAKTLAWGSSHKNVD